MAVPASFALCPECLARYGALRFDADAQCSLNIMPLGTLTWSDEHPKDAMGLPDVIAARGVHEACGRSIMRLAGVRTRLWRSGAVPDEKRAIWEEAQRVLPDWPGFQRLTLNADQQTSLEACDREASDLFGMITSKFPDVTLTDRGDGTVHFRARRVPPIPQLTPFGRWIERVGDIINPILIGGFVLFVCISLLKYCGVVD